MRASSPPAYTPSPSSAYPASSSAAYPVAESTPVDPHLLTREESQALFQRIVRLTIGGGDVTVTVRSSWLGSLHWGRNRPTAAASVTSQRVLVQRIVGNRIAEVETDELDDAALTRLVRLAEGQLQPLGAGVPELPGPQPYAAPPLWDDAVAHATVESRSDAARAGVEAVRRAQCVAAGYLETSAETWGIFNTKGLAAYAAATGVQYTETVRQPEAKGSGWAGQSQPAWAKLDVAGLSARALHGCLTSVNPVRVEPGRWTTVLAPEAVGHFLLPAVDGLRDRALVDRQKQDHPYGSAAGAMLGQRVFDERITISTDPMDPDAPYLPFDEAGYPYRPVTWVEKGVLKELPYDMAYARQLGQSRPLPNPYACRMSGSDTGLEALIASTERGLLVTRLGHLAEGNLVETGTKRLMVQTVTRDGVWLIEKGKVKAPVVNLRVLESPMYVFNSVEQLGRPERILGYGWTSHWALDLERIPSRAVGRLFPMVVPPMKVRDFNFVSLTDAV